MAGLSDLYQIIKDSIFPSIVPDVDQSEVFTVYKADGTTLVVDVSTNATPRFEMVSGADIIGWKDVFTTIAYRLNGTNGDISGGSVTVTGIVSSAQVNSSGGVAATGAVSGASLSVTGDAAGGALVATGASHTLPGGGMCIGQTTATTVGAAGAGAALPATPTGYLVFYMGTTPFKIPYYAA